LGEGEVGNYNNGEASVEISHSFSVNNGQQPIQDIVESMMGSSVCNPNLFNTMQNLIFPFYSSFAPLLFIFSLSSSLILSCRGECLYKHNHHSGAVIP